jgi:peptidoglycan hydrolase-like protein with peptidoglycan-binding domain
MICSGVCRRRFLVRVLLLPAHGHHSRQHLEHYGCLSQRRERGPTRSDPYHNGAMVTRGRNSPRAAPALAAVTLVGMVGAVGAVGLLNRDEGAAAVPSSTVLTSSATAALPTAVPTTAPPTTVPKTTIAQPLGKGMVGEEVTRLQERLQLLGFQPGPIDGEFGELTQMAVWAYEKLVMGVGFKEPDGIVTPEMWLALQDPLNVTALRPEAGKHTEIYLPKQVLVVFDGATPVFISHISSGELAPPGDDFRKGADWNEVVTIDPGEIGNETGTEPIEQGMIGNSWTPAGVYEFTRKVNGKRESRLGGMLNPVYFNYGIAVHGASTLPLEPASHGCIRIPNSISQTFYDLVNIGERVFVFDGVEEPEEYGSPPGWFDRKDPSYTTTTTSTTTTMSEPVVAQPSATSAPTPPPVTTSTAVPAETPPSSPSAS